MENKKINIYIFFFILLTCLSCKTSEDINNSVNKYFDSSITCSIMMTEILIELAEYIYSVDSLSSAEVLFFYQFQVSSLNKDGDFEFELNNIAITKGENSSLLLNAVSYTKDNIVYIPVIIPPCNYSYKDNSELLVRCQYSKQTDNDINLDIAKCIEALYIIEENVIYSKDKFRKCVTFGE